MRGRWFDFRRRHNFYFEFSLVFRSSQLDGANANEIKHYYSSVVHVVLNQGTVNHIPPNRLYSSRLHASSSPKTEEATFLSTFCIRVINSVIIQILTRGPSLPKLHTPILISCDTLAVPIEVKFCTHLLFFIPLSSFINLFYIISFDRKTFFTRNFIKCSLCHHLQQTILMLGDAIHFQSYFEKL